MTCLLRGAALSALLALVACDSDRGSTVSPPEPNLTIEMDGTWAVADIARRDSTAPLPTPSPIGAPLFPIASGQLIGISGGVAYGYGPEPLFANWGGVPAQRYVNVADGRTWQLDVATAWQTSCASTLSVRAGFAAMDEDTMEGFVDVRYASDCEPSFLIHEPNGLFAVRLVRVAVQAAFEAGTSPR